MTKQVRSRIKEITWAKQDAREGFRDTFKPLMQQFEKPEDDKTKQFYSNKNLIKNQLAITPGLAENQLLLMMMQLLSQFKKKKKRLIKS